MRKDNEMKNKKMRGGKCGTPSESCGRGGVD
jgi:hypothetical protein